MTTEVGSASEVKKQSDQLGADATKEKLKEVAENQQNQSSDPEEEKGSQSPPPAESQSSPRRQKKEKDPSESRGISRFIPPWLKKQKSYNLVVAKDGGDKKEPAQAAGEEQILDKEESLPEEERQAKGDAEETAQRKQQEIKVDVKEEKPVPVEEVSIEREEEKVKEIQEDKSDEAAKRETKEVQTNELKAEKASQRATKKTRTVQCKVTLLGGTEYSCDLEKRAKGQVLFDRVCEHLNLLEKDYFGLVFQENPEQKNWLDPAKEMKRQLRNLPWLFSFNVKFYPPDPSQLTEDITRYFLCLQLREDIASGRLPCSFVTHALLGSYTLQAELGDYDPEEHGSHDLSDFQFAPTQTKELEEKVAELHKTHRGLSPAQADSQFLENAKRLSMYGVDLHHAKDSEGVDIKLGVCANGLLIYKDRLRINRFAWPKILKISYKRSNFYIKVRPAELEQFESTIGFKLPNHRAAKRLWKVCVEHHTFYRLVSPEQPPKAKFLTLGSKFRYSGRTQAQTRQASTLIDRPAPHFERTSSKRVSRSLDGALIGGVDRSLTKDFPGPAGEVSARGPGAVSPAVVQDGDGSRDIRSPAKTPHVQLTEGKAKTEEEETQLEEKNSLRVEGDNIYVRHSNLMLEDLDKAQEEILKHQASISELKRNFMESTPEPRPNEWEKRRITPLSLQTQGSSLETLNIVEEKKQAEVGKDERVTPAEMNGKEPSPGHGPGEMRKVEPGTQKDPTPLSSESSSESEEEAEDVGEYRPHRRAPEGAIREEQGEYEEEVDEAPGPAAKVVERQDPVPAASAVTQAGASVGTVETVTQEKGAGPQIPAEKSVNEGAVKQDVSEEAEDEQQKVNGDVAPVDIDVLPQIICCSEPPVVKTEMVTISDASQRTEISTKEVPIVQTETKTITYESPQIDGGAGGDSGTLLTAQTVTSESVSTTTTTHITKTVKGGISETRIEKRIVITGDADIDHDQALAQAIREAREQHPDMSVTRVVVHKETELDEGEE
ncbi:band 4.1-like protein 2 isoform X1 [Delphinus delphis]|uniref:Protein 4.1 n=1 Tax=Tursiops truncatus TaxID=9739 RepID=A0A6J3SAN3_TURTR|nr:band 4.1-like protein 2 isoform X6 [Tursiops truncatus]XP_059885941.1 band 4.1-like protein 2 isoform X1 [Delphinus delphis]XP_059885942.1 band 4.1-like protein 2 isoform X1 [Delphinus delphis]XP_059885944.1 band 4.1-like protein 2 isoform X1 [Delphinus delphis]XP_059885945.1 band 4.1-like protein 2 isoform X1 [Delphinus delphis]XP_059885946.1 band 4.1-like protein 2 isoform X1 [Delphinus delphis]XP_059885947.1 band 4.1-like protein 2 isoform X1 [Delphinus delphis]